MRGINVYIGEVDLITNNQTQVVELGGRTVWVNARPYGRFTSILDRFKYAYYVVTGRADVVVWMYEEK